MTRPFVKARDTVTSVASSQRELERTLKRYGATTFGVTTDYQTGALRVSFRVPDDASSQAASVPVRLEINTENVRLAMYGPLKHDQKWTDRAMQQSERVAWRHLVLWVDAALSAAAAGVQKVSEAFLAHTLVQVGTEPPIRLVDHMDKIAPNGNWRALLPPGQA